MIAYCTQCGDEFWREEDEHWKRLCYDCWLARKNQQDENRTQIENRRLKTRIDELERQNRRMADQIARAPERGTKIPDEFWRFLVLCCHPNKHGNSRISNEVTRWLLAQRKQGDGYGTD